MSRHAIAAVLAALAVTACADGSPLPTATEAVRSDAAIAASERPTAAGRWNTLTREVFRRGGGTPNDAGRVFALVSVAQYNAVIAAEDARARGVHPSEAGAVASASAAVLAGLYPAHAAFINGELAKERAMFPTRPVEKHMNFAAGLQVGAQVGAAVLAYAATDGAATASVLGTVHTGDGYWYSAPPPAQPAQPSWGLVEPWLMTSGSQFRNAPPPLWGSAEFQAAIAEVLHYSDTRTPAQLDIARFWGTGTGPGAVAGFYGAIASRMALERNMDEYHTAQLLATLHMAIMDASIGCYDGKYHYWTIRPWQADSRITTPIGQPNFPAYPSGHSCGSASAGGVLAAFFPSEAEYFEGLVAEAGMSRIYAGLHFRFDITAGQELGYNVAALAVAAGPKGHKPIPLD